VNKTSGMDGELTSDHC